MIPPRLRQLQRVTAFAGSLLLAASPAAEKFAAEVYRDDAITIQAGLEDISSRIAQFGDVLTVIVTVSYDPNKVSITDPDDKFFTAALPASGSTALVDWQVQRNSGPGPQTEKLHARLRVQIVGCPDEELTCPGDRTYPLPAFTLEYQDLRASDADTMTRSIHFRPWPETLTVFTTIATDEEDQLYPFDTYFPTGGYPNPLTGRDSTGASVLTAGIALTFLIGGLLMWPFRSREQRVSAAESPRWLSLLKELREDNGENEGRFLDGLRRCLVWYCNDELAIDPFIWLDLAEPGDEAEEEATDDRTHAELRSLFVELLHNPEGRGAELRTRLEKLTGQTGIA